MRFLNNFTRISLKITGQEGRLAPAFLDSLGKQNSGGKPPFLTASSGTVMLASNLHIGQSAMNEIPEQFHPELTQDHRSGRAACPRSS